MSDISDNDLILFHYRDGLPSERLREIEMVLASSPALELRYQALRRLLADTDRDTPPPQPDPQFEARLWQRLQPRLDAADAPTVATAPTLKLARHGARPRRRLRRWSGGLAASAMLVVAIYFSIARDKAPLPLPLPLQPPPRVAAQEPMADRVLANYVATHLRSTEGVLLSVINNDGTTLTPAGDAYVRSLADDNRLYAAAATQRGDKALAGFLQSLDPVLIELANQPRSDDAQQIQGLRDFVRSRDLLFQVRAVEVRLQSRSSNRVKTRGAMT